MDKIKDVKSIYRESFRDSADYVEMYFNRVYREEDARVGCDPTGKIVTSLLLQQYHMNFAGTKVPMGYIAGAATRKAYRGQGYMACLLADTLAFAYDRGDYFCALIPAHRWLYDYYSRFGFSTVFYIREMRYTSAHDFTYEGSYDRIDNIAVHEVYDAFAAFNEMRSPVVIHSYDDYLNIIEDNRMDNGLAFALRDVVSGLVKAVVFAVVSGGRVVVRELLAADPDAEAAAMSVVMETYPGMSATVIAPASDSWTGPIESRAMMRIINVAGVLKSMAAADPSMKMKIRVHDRDLPANSHIYVIDRGEVVINDGYTGRLDLDVTPSVLCSIIFSSPAMGRIFNLDTHRPHISLMLD